MLVPIENLTEHGVIRDVEDYLLPPNAWTDARNVRFRDRGLLRMGGSKAVLDPPSVAPYWALHVSNEAKASHWIYAGLTDVFTFTSGSHFEITRVSGDYVATADRLWNGGLLHGIPILNNGVDVPQVWLPVSSGQKLVDLTSWPTTDRARTLRPFKNFLFALDMTVSGSRFPHRLKISHPADPGSVPSSWDETDPTKDVTQRDIGDDESDGLLDAVPLGGIVVLYKERSTHYAQFIGGTQKWKTDKLFEQSGLLADHCAVAFAEGRAHFVMTGEDLIVHNGQTRTSIIDKKLRRWLLANIDTTNWHRSFSVSYTEENECWFCFPLSGSSFANLALVYNTLDGSVTFREIDQASFIAPGLIPQETSDTWDADAGAWDADTTSWDTLAHAPFVRRLLQCKPVGTKLLHLETTEQFAGVNFNAFVERTGLDVIGLDRSGRSIRDRRSRRLIRGVWLYASGAPFTVQIQTQEDVDGPTVWSMPQTFTPGVDEKVDFGLHSRLWGIRFSMANAALTEIQSYAVDVEPLGGF